MATKKKQKFVVSEKLQQRLDDYHLMLDISPDPSVIYDTQGQVVYVNPAFCELTGYGPHELMGKSPSVLQGPNTDKEVLRRLNQNITDGELFHGRAINYRRDGSEFMMEWKIAPIRNKKDEITHYLAIQRDVS